MTLNEDEKKIFECFSEFFKAMYEWEKEANDLDDKDADEQLFPGWKLRSKKKRDEIFQRYLTDRKRAYSDPFSFEWPYKFEIELEEVTSIEIKNHQAHVYTIKSDPTDEDFKYERCFKFKKTKEKWLLDNIKIRFDLNEKWDSYVI
ncbi:NTF2 fold immunity protein [Neisseria sp. Ec49-e6-T10]|uniref:NTF2 fold immunity protein n=1 Tax=Neisseria sp. Ec49-e6-T10 TaxID=3140744 RepID=UPI003EC09EC4